MKTGYIILVAVGIPIGFLLSFVLRSSDPPPTETEADFKTEQSTRRSNLSPNGGSERKHLTLEQLNDEEMFVQPAADDAELDSYLEANAYSREAVIAAALLSKNIGYLIDAAQRFPDDPQVQLLVLDRDDFPGDKQEWYERFRKSQPDNMLATMLHGTHLLARGATEEAVEELRIASGQRAYNDFTAESSLAKESALLDLDRSPLEAKVRSVSFNVSAARQLNSAHRALRDLIDSAESAEEKQKLAILGISLGNQMTQGNASSSTMNRLVGYSMESGFLSKLDPGLESPAFAQTPAEMIAEIKAESAKLREEVDAFSEEYRQLNERQTMHYLERLRTLGEADAVAWAREQVELNSSQAAPQR